MSEVQALPTPLYRNYFSLEIFPFAEPTTAEKSLLKLIEDLKFANWEVNGEGILVTIGIEETEENLERLHKFIAALRNKEAIKTLTIHRENPKLQSFGFMMFDHLVFKSMRSGIDSKLHETVYTRVTLTARHFAFGKKKTEGE